MEFSDRQNLIFKEVEHGKGHIEVTAVAGSGKTTTIIEALKRTPKTAKVAMFAFNKIIAEELLKRAPMHVTVSTFHSFGLKQITRNLGYHKTVTRYVDYMLDSFESTAMQKGMSKEEYKEKSNLRSQIKKVVSLSKATLINYEDMQEVERLCDSYNVEVNGSLGSIMNLLSTIMLRCIESNVIDFDDMIWKPIVKKVNVEKFDFIFIDERQDLNKAQEVLALMALAPQGRIIAVGDERQSIYGFRGANIRGMQEFREQFKPTLLPLDISYRCTKSTAQLLNSLYPEYPFTVPDTAIDGIVDEIEAKEVFDLAMPDDLILCRKNAPLVNYAFQLIRKGKKAVIRGRDIGQNLSTLIDKMKATNIPALFTALHEYEQVESAKLIASKKVTKLQALQDKISTIEAIAENCSSIEDIHTKIDQIFSDDVIGVVLSSVHKAKGLESNQVFIVEPENMPLPRVLRDGTQEEIEQEHNIRIVAYTRNKKAMHLVITSSVNQEQEKEY